MKKGMLSMKSKFLVLLSFTMVLAIIYSCSKEITGKSPGYICNNGSCESVDDNADYYTISACQSACENSSSGYNCANGTCVQVSDNAQYATLSACQSACGTPPPLGFNCVNGTCTQVNSNGQYATLSACQSACGTPPPLGYNCENGTCVQVSGNSQFTDLASCQNNCAQQTGKVTFYKSCLFTETNISINGLTKQISQGFETVPLCDAPGTATFTLPVGTYTFTETPYCAGLSSRAVNVTPGSCTKVNVQSSACDPINFFGYPCGRKISFWSHGVSGCGAITVTINGITKQITKFYPNSIPQNEEGFAVFNRLPPGKYPYTASCGNHSWAGEVELPLVGVGQPGFDKRVELIEPGYGKVSFWRTCFTCDPSNCSDGTSNTLEVSINGNTEFIPCVISPGILYNCEAPGQAGTFFLPAGTYQYQYKTCCSEYTKYVTVYAGECEKVDLTF